MLTVSAPPPPSPPVAAQNCAVHERVLGLVFRRFSSSTIASVASSALHYNIEELSSAEILSSSSFQLPTISFANMLPFSSSSAYGLPPSLVASLDPHGRLQTFSRLLLRHRRAEEHTGSAKKTYGLPSSIVASLDPLGRLRTFPAKLRYRLPPPMASTR